MTIPEFTPEIAQLRTLLLGQTDRFVARGYSIDIQPFGVMTTGGRRGLILTATSSTGIVHTFSVDSETDVLHHVKLLVDGQLREETTGGTMFIMPQDLCAVVKPCVDWFINTHLE